MALVFKDNSELKNFKDILNYYKKLFEDVLNTTDKNNKKNHGANPFLPDKWAVPTGSVEETTIIYVYNPGYNYLKGLINTVEATKNGIHKGLRTLFINYDEPEEYWQEDLNYNLINAYAESSRMLDFYNKKTEKFEERPEYFWTRGNYYDMLPMCTQGKYLLAYKPAVENACKILEDYKTMFYNYKCTFNTTGGESDGIILRYNNINSSFMVGGAESGTASHIYGSNNIVSERNRYFYLAFWNEHLASMKSKIENSGQKTLGSMLRIGQKTQYPEQMDDSKVVYVKKYYSNLWEDMSTGTNGKTVKSQKVVNTQKVSSNCGTYTSSIKVEDTEG